MVAVVATQLISPLLWDHYAVVLLVPTAWLLARGAWWALAIPLATVAAARADPAGRRSIRSFFVVALLAPFTTIRAATARHPRGLGRMSSDTCPAADRAGARSAVAALVYWLCARQFDAGRSDFYYLADAFLHGRTWLESAPGPNDVIIIGGRFYVPFAPFPAIAAMPLIALIGPEAADRSEPIINAILAGATVGMCWWLVGRLGVSRLRDRFWLALLFGFSTQILWITTRGGVWHTGQLIATLLTFGCLLELWGKRRAWLIGLLAGAAFLTRAPLAFAVPFYALLLVPALADRPIDSIRGYLDRGARGIPWRAWGLLALGVLPSIVFFFAYNQIRFGSPWESGYALATLPPFLQQQRAVGLFALAHVPMNLDYLFFHLPKLIPDPPFFKPDGLGLIDLPDQPGAALRGARRLAADQLLAAARRPRWPS